MENENYKYIVFVLVLIVVFGWFKYKKLEKKNEVLQYSLSSYVDSLNQANQNIEDAQSQAWSSYDEMGEALDNLSTVNP